MKFMIKKSWWHKIEKNQWIWRNFCIKWTLKAGGEVDTRKYDRIIIWT